MHDVWFFDGKIIDVKADLIPFVNTGHEFHYYFPESSYSATFNDETENMSTGLYVASLS